MNNVAWLNMWQLISVPAVVYVCALRIHKRIRRKKNYLPLISEEAIFDWVEMPKASERLFG